MTATYSEAVDAMFALFNAAWTAGAAAIVGTVPEIRWQGVEGPNKPPANGYWCMVGVQTVAEPQSTFKTGVEPLENRRYTAIGFLVVQLFCPMSDAQSAYKGRLLAELARNAFRGQETSNGVWFRNGRIEPLPPEENAHRFNIIVEYQYDDIG